MTAEEWGDFLRWWPIWSPALLLILGGASTGIWVIVNRRGGEKAARKNPLPPTWPEMWARIDAQDEKIDELERLLLAATGEVGTLTSEVKRRDDQIDQLIQHILRLEPLVPTPPGPPARPHFLIA